jgi:TolB-like protein
MESFGHYTILERIGEGALGELYRARDTRLGRTVALRLVSPDLVSDQARKDALLADAAAAAGLSHPHIAALFEFGEEHGRVFLAHEFVPGQSMQALFVGRPFDVNLALEFSVQIADALAEGHRQGIVHGELRPATIYVTPKDQTKVIDFGFGSWTAAGAARRAVAEQLATGHEPAIPHGDTLAMYLSPEQVLGERADGRSDVFALGVILYQMLTGRAPFVGGTPGGTALKILQTTPPPPSRQIRTLPVGFDNIAARALAKSLDKRYASTSLMAADIRALADELNVPVTSELHRWKEETRSRPWQRALKRVAIVMAVLAVLGGIGAAVWSQREAIRRFLARDPAVSKPTVVVMPFDVAPADPGKAYIGLGFSEDLAARLGEVPGLSVVGRSMIRETPVPSAEALARRLNAGAALRGTVRPGPYALHVDVQLVEAKTGQVVWGEHFARDPRQGPAVQAEIAKQVAERLRLPMPTGNRWARAQSRQVDAVGYDLYLQARDAVARRDRARGIALFRQAVETDSKLIEARVGLSEALYQADFYSGGSGDTNTIDRAREEAEAALAVDPELPRAQLAAGLSAPTAIAAASSIGRALSLDASLGEAWQHAGDLVVGLDPQRAIALYQQAIALDPALDAVHRDVAIAFEMLNRLPDGEQAIERGQSARPDRPWWLQLRARIEIVRENYDRAVELLGSDPSTESAPFVWLLGRIGALRLAGKTDAARSEAVSLTTKFPWFCEGQAVLAGLTLDGGDNARARTIADTVFAQTSSPSAPAQALQCAAMTSAAIGDAPGTASYLSKLAGDERALRVWTRNGTYTMALSLGRNWYPWNKVSASAPMQQAMSALKQSLDRLREEELRRLPTPATAMAEK